MKNSFALVTLLLIFISGGIYAQGEDCPSATLINNLPFTTTFNNSTFTDDYNAYCNAPFDDDGGKDAVFLYNPSSHMFIDILTCSPIGATNFDTKIYVYKNTCPASGLPSPAGTEVACNDDDCDGPNYPLPYLSRIKNFQVTAGNSYFIVVDAYNNLESGLVTLDVMESEAVNDLAIRSAFFSNSYPCLPFSQIIAPDIGVVELKNNGTSDFSDVTVTMDVFCDNDPFPVYSTSTSQFNVPAGQMESVSLGPYSMQSDSPKLFTFCFAHDRSFDDTSSNDTIYDFILVNDTIWCNDHYLLGATPSFFNMVGATSQSEIGALFVPENEDTLTSVTVALGVDIDEIGNEVKICVYNSVDTNKAAIAMSKVATLDTGKFFYTLVFENGVVIEADSLYLISIKSGTVSVGATTVLATPFSSWGRLDPNDSWGFFTGIDWMIWANLGKPKIEDCPAPIPVTQNIGLREALLTWNVIPGALGYEISGGLQGSHPSTYTVIQINNGNSSSYLATQLTKGTNYVWRIRAACDFISGSGPVWGPYSQLVSFTTQNCLPPTPISTNPIQPNAARLNWIPQASAIGYRVLGQQSNPPVGGVIEIQVTPGSKSFYDATGLKPNTTYQWGIITVCDLSPYTESSFSGVAQFTTPTSKTGLLPASGGNSSMSIFPNPANDVFTISFSSDINMVDIKVEISDVTGRIFRAENTVQNNSITFSTAQLSSGIYQIVVKSDNAVFSDKVVIQK